MALNWFPLLVDRGNDHSLLHNSPYNTNKEYIICDSFGNRRRFARFPTYAHLLAHIYALPPDARCFFEVIFGYASQKLYFDIDAGDADFETIRTAVYELARTAACIFEPAPARAIVFTSCGTKKISFHIVVDGVYLASSDEVRTVAETVLQKSGVSRHLGAFVDMGVYKSVQQMRILHCRKFGVDRVKSIDGGWSKAATDSRSDEISAFASSLITNISGCVLVPPSSNAMRAISTMRPPQTLHHQGELVPTDNGDTANAISAMFEHLKSLGGKAPFIVRDALASPDGNRIIVNLIRTDSSMCHVCKRVHESENPFLIIATDACTVTLDCRRGGKLTTSYEKLVTVPDGDISPCKPKTVRKPKTTQNPKLSPTAKIKKPRAKKAAAPAPNTPTAPPNLIMSLENFYKTVDP